MKIIKSLKCVIKLRKLFLSLQLDTKNNDVAVPDIKLEMFPKEAYTAGKQNL